jgi:F-type H+-transporting ATPase subunit a
VIEEVVKPVTLALRLFGNLFAGILMVWLISQLGVFLGTPLVGVWKAFDVFFIGTLQAFIFMLLTVIYFGMVREGMEEHSDVGVPAHS